LAFKHPRWAPISLERLDRSSDVFVSFLVLDAIWRPHWWLARNFFGATGVQDHRAVLIRSLPRPGEIRQDDTYRAQARVAE